MGKKVEEKTKKKVEKKDKFKRLIRIFWVLFALPFVLLGVLITLTSTGYFGDLPTFEELENPNSDLATEIFSEDGKLIGSFFLENRSHVEYSDLSVNLVAALVSTEDVRFYSHSGIDFISLARVGVKTLAMGNRSQGGGSTITQQLAKNLFPRDENVYTNPVSRAAKLVTQKLKEWITAIKLEHNYTKDEIVAMYLNTVAYGSNAFGIKSASTTFFNTTPDMLKVEQAALLVGVVNAPTRYSPVRNPKNALARRNTVISRMQANGYLTAEVSDSLQNMPLGLDFTPISHLQGAGTYFREMLRGVMTASEPKRSAYNSAWDYNEAKKQWEEDPIYGWCNKNFKADGTKYNIYRDGLKIYTTINSSMQKYAEEAVQEHISKVVQPMMEKQYHPDSTIFNDVDSAGIARIMQSAMRNTDRYRGLKKSGKSEEYITEVFNKPSKMKIFTYNRGDVDTLLSPNDSLLYYKRMLRASLVAMDPLSGGVRAYVGGTNFVHFKYDMARQGKRQVGSTIKPFIYTFAIDQLGYSPCTMVPNLPTTIETDTGDAWQPRESGNADVYDGTMKPLQWGLAKSRNNYSSWIMKQAKQPAAVADFIHKLGISSYIYPAYAMCLGTPDVSLYEMVEAYCTYVNRGVHTTPVFVTRIEDRQGNLVSSVPVTTSDVISEQSSYTMIGMLKNVVDVGTAARLRWMYGFYNDIGGKTGTTQNSSDTWFMGIAPKLVAGVWVGCEDRSVHIDKAEGSVLAMPIYAGFMKRVYANDKLDVKRADKFDIPVGTPVYDCKEEIEQATRQTLESDNDEDEFFF
ncbi:MAG: transglycosylase domain-containing protein [Rikenellaceae bacterium]